MSMSPAVRAYRTFSYAITCRSHCMQEPTWRTRELLAAPKWLYAQGAKYSPQELRSEFRWLRCAEFREQFCFRVRPLNRLRVTIEFIQVGPELLLKCQRTQKITQG